MAKLKSENHHWWPECVSRLWADEAGQTTRISPDGSEKKAPPKNWGGIGNGHMIKLGDDPEAYSPWDESFEDQFAEADGRFPHILRLCEAMPWEDRRGLKSIRDRFAPQQIDDETFAAIIECLVSLAVRSPMTREHAVALAEHHRGPLPGRKRNAIIGLNLRQRMAMIRSGIGARGKIALLHSSDREFIFGDGFYHNVTGSSVAPPVPQMVVPLTPRLTALFVRPMRFMTEPRLVTLVVDRREADALNEAVQIYARNMIFYRAERPTLCGSFRRAAHLRYADLDNPIDRLIHRLPGVEERDPGLMAALARAKGKG